MVFAEAECVFERCKFPEELCIPAFVFLLLGKVAPTALSKRHDHDFELGSALFEHSDPMQPAIVMRTDGGADHNATFMQVQASLISIFCACNLEKLVAVRTAPGCSYVNDCEKGMAVFYVGLENTSLERGPMEANSETRAENANCMSELRAKAEKISCIQRRLDGIHTAGC